jgi:WD40 repeat protein
VLVRLQHSIADVRDAEFNAAGDRVLTAGGTDYSARIWDATQHRELSRLNHDGVVNWATFSPDGSRALTASGDHTARIWDVSSGKELRRLIHDQAVRQAVYSPDGQRIITSSDDHSARIWDAQTGRELARLNHDARDGIVVREAAFSPDGSRVVTASSDHTARVWDAESGREMARFRHANAVLSASFFPDGQRVLTASSDLAHCGYFVVSDDCPGADVILVSPRICRVSSAWILACISQFRILDSLQSK